MNINTWIPTHMNATIRTLCTRRSMWRVWSYHTLESYEQITPRSIISTEASVNPCEELRWFGWKNINNMKNIYVISWTKLVHSKTVIPRKDLPMSLGQMFRSSTVCRRQRNSESADRMEAEIFTWLLIVFSRVLKHTTHARLFNENKTDIIITIII